MKAKDWLLVLACAALLALRKPWALHTPQLWAEDGSIFLTQNDQMGLRAWWEPYNGYLQLLPRLIAWTASRVADPAWWPAFYNGLSFVINVGLFARLASPRVDLPSKPWLMLAFVLVVGSGEPLLNATNAQWITAFFLVLQLFTVHPTNAGQRLGDLAILLVAGLNGPFAVMLLPFLVWRAWCDRHRDAFLALAVVAACAAVQALFLARVGLRGDDRAEPFHPLNFLSTAGSRLVIWPIAGPAAVRAWPEWVQATAGVALIGALVVRALRAAAPRSWRGVIAALFIVITLASVYRSRADLWNYTDMANGDRYFYIPRVLLAWLLIGEFNSQPRGFAWLARGSCLIGIATHLPHFILPAPPDYHWAAHCDPIRRGVPAQIKTLPEGWLMEYPGRPLKP